MFRPAQMILLAGTALAGCSADPAGNNASGQIVVENGQAAALPGPAAAETKGQDFASTALGNLDFTLESARLAAERAGQADVKQYAQALSGDAAAAREQLTGIITASQLKAEPLSTPTHQSDLAILSSTRGAPLDQAFADQQVKALSELVGLLRAYKNGGDNAQLKSWAEATQAKLNDRLLDLQSLGAAMQEAADPR